MKKVLISIGVIVGLVAVFEVGLLFFPWTGPTHGQLPLAEKNQRLWALFAPVPLWERGATPSQHTEAEALIDRVQELEARLADLEKQGASQNSATSPGPVSYTDQELLESRDQGPNRPGCDAIRARAARNVPNWLELNFISAFGCLTPTEERIRKLENQAQFAPRNRP